MSSITIDTTDSQFIITIDKERLLRFIDSLRLETLAEKIDFSDAIEELGREIKSDWWDRNKEKIIPNTHIC